MNFETLLQDQGLAVALAVLLVLFLIWFVKRQQHTIENHIAHNSEIMTAVKASVDAQTVATAAQTKVLEEFTRYIQARDLDRPRPSVNPPLL